MGCDIHLRLEKRLKKDKPYYNEFLDHDNNRIKNVIILIKIENGKTVIFLQMIILGEKDVMECLLY